MEIAPIDSVNKNADSLDMLGSVVPTESQNGLYKNKLRGNQVFWSTGKTQKNQGQLVGKTKMKLFVS